MGISHGCSEFALYSRENREGPFSRTVGHEKGEVHVNTQRDVDIRERDIDVTNGRK